MQLHEISMKILWTFLYTILYIKVFGILNMENPFFPLKYDNPKYSQSVQS